MTNYLVHSSILLSGFTLFYWFLLRNETFFKLNRITIIAGIFLCLTLPLIQIPSSFSMWNSAEKPITAMIEKVGQNETPVLLSQNDAIQKPEYKKKAQSATAKSQEGLSFSEIMTKLYIVGVVIFFLVFLAQLIILLTKRLKLNTFKTGKYTIVEMTKEEEPYSFFNSIFINPNSYDPETYEHIIEHEKIHIDQSHFVDKIIAEILVIVFWFNPITWLLRSSVSKNLEFLTDYSLIQKGIEVNKYQMSLLKVSVSNKPFNLTMSYNNSFLKNRIIMMNSKKSSVVSSWKYLFILPLFIFSLISLNAVSADHMNQVNTKVSVPTTPIPPFDNEVEDVYENENPDKADLNIVKRKFDLDEITSVGLSINTNVSISQGNQQLVEVEGPLDLVNKLNQEVKNGNWNIEFRRKEKHKNSKAIKINITVKYLDALAISGSGRITGLLIQIPNH